MKLKINLRDAYKINKSEKTFCVFETDKNNKIQKYILTEDLHRHYKQGENNFRLTEIIKNEIKTILI
jgi:hypothetical protein